MSRQLHISVAIELPADEWQEARHKCALKPVLDQFTDGLAAAGIKFATKIDTCDVKAKRADAGVKRARKPRVVAPEAA
jgi:hypothetical protein